MITRRVVFMLIGLVLAILARGLWAPVAASSTSRGSYRWADERPVIDEPRDSLQPASGGGVRLDRYGNEIESAIGDYRLDGSGDVYERHSPQTEVASLPGPSI